MAPPTHNAAVRARARQSDKFSVPYEGSRGAIGGATSTSGGARLASGGGGLLPPHALDSFVLRVPESDVEALPRLLDAAMARHASMYRALLAYRTAYLYELPLDGHVAAGGAVCAVMAEVTRRFAPHLSAWRGAAAANAGRSANRTA